MNQKEIDLLKKIFLLAKKNRKKLLFFYEYTSDGKSRKCIQLYEEINALEIKKKVIFTTLREKQKNLTSCFYDFGVCDKSKEWKKNLQIWEFDENNKGTKVFPKDNK